MVGKTFTYLTGSENAALFFNSKNHDLNAEDVYAKLITPVFGKGVCYDVPNKVNSDFFSNILSEMLSISHCFLLSLQNCYGLKNIEDDRFNICSVEMFVVR